MTIRNFAWALIVLVVGILAVDAVTHVRAPRTEDFGRLYDRHIGKDDVVATRTPVVVTEAPVPDQTSADPLLLSAAARSQYLGATPLPGAPAAPQVLCPPSDPGCAPAAVAQPVATSTVVKRGGPVAIVGDASGVTVVSAAKSTAPKLSGGIFR